MTSLNPTMTIGDQIAGPVRIHLGLSRAAARKRAEEVLGLVGLPRPAERLDSYPHQVSGGLRQRVMIAMALSCEPKLLIADEPTTALDVTIQAQILRLLDELKVRLDMGMLLVTHDMGVIAGRADRVLVMYAGRIVEAAPTDVLFSSPRHPYTEALLGAIPRMTQDRGQDLYSIPGLPPDLSSPPAGCRFAARCRYATDVCRDQDPALEEREPAHEYACFHPRTGAAPSQQAAVIAGERQQPATGMAAAPLLLELQDVHKEFGIRKAGGQRQRIGLARALALSPRLIVADEPVSALDVSIQAQVLNLMKSLQARFGLTYIVISHDLSVVKYLADRIGVM